MFMLNKKILVNGCGLTFGQQEIKGWPKILTAIGVNVVDLSGPAVSNQWIVDRTTEYLLQYNDVHAVVLQLTNVDKLDVKIDPERKSTLVDTDSNRNFIWKDIWPSSVSIDHPSKELYFKHLYSPELLTKELAIKLTLLNFWCQQHNIELYIYQGYSIPWSHSDLDLIKELILNLDEPWGIEYKNSDFYKGHDFSNQNSVPCIEYAFWLADRVVKKLKLPVADRLAKIQQAYAAKYSRAYCNTVNTL